MTQSVCILDYGSGNVRSVFNLFVTCAPNVKISNRIEDIRNASHLVLPGVGSFGAAMEKIRAQIPLLELEEEVKKKGKPFLGICVGMQVLANKGLEFGEHQGLGWIDGTVSPLETTDLPLPHMGWNQVECVAENRLWNSSQHEDFYFVHSYAFRLASPAYALGMTDYGSRFASVINKDSIYGVQFHPEKSQKTGRRLVENFLKIQ